uniref:Oleosin n=1 Tax=Kalanchoe fedtschenkoi TaxID=63787 RepID=A0A7N0UT87_KALFE
MASQLTTSDQTRPITHHTSPAARQTAKFVTAALLGGSTLVLSGLTLTATVLGLAVATPLFVLFSPVLAPALIATLMIGAGFLVSGGCGAAALVGFTWLYNYATGKRPLGADQIDFVKDEISGKATDMKDFVKDYAKAGRDRSDQEVRRT